MYATDKGAQVINLSYGGAHTDVIMPLLVCKNAGSLLVMAAGNWNGYFFLE